MSESPVTLVLVRDATSALAALRAIGTDLVFVELREAFVRLGDVICEAAIGLTAWADENRKAGLLPPIASTVPRGARWASPEGVKWRVGSHQGRQRWVEVAPARYRVKR